VKIENQTWLDRYALEDLVEAARIPGVREPWLIQFLTDYSVHGRTERYGPDHETARVLIWIGPPPSHTPPGYSWTRTPRYARSVRLHGLTELLLHIIAHEMKHCAQADPRGLAAERDADAHACRVLRRYRRTGRALSPVHQPSPARCA
jgi:hypothetical protein